MHVMTRQALLLTGHTDNSLAAAVKKGLLHRVGPGLYADRVDPDPEVRHLALARAMTPPPTGAWALETAALLHGFAVSRVPPALQAVTPGDGRSHRGAMVWSSSAPLTDADVDDQTGAWATSPARTVVDLARIRPFMAGVVTADSALLAARVAGQTGLTTHLQEQLARAACRRGVSGARAVVEFASALAESPGESRSRVVIARLGLPAPVLQWEIAWPDAPLVDRVDFGWPELGVVGEYDGEQKYRSPAAGRTTADVILDERERQQRLEDRGLIMVRWGRREVNQPALLHAKLTGAFARARRRPVPVIPRAA